MFYQTVVVSTLLCAVVWWGDSIKKRGASHLSNWWGKHALWWAQTAWHLGQNNGHSDMDNPMHLLPSVISRQRFNFSDGSHCPNRLKGSFVPHTMRLSGRKQDHHSSLLLYCTAHWPPCNPIYTFCFAPNFLMCCRVFTGIYMPFTSGCACCCKLWISLGDE